MSSFGRLTDIERGRILAVHADRINPLNTYTFIYAGTFHTHAQNSSVTVWNNCLPCLLSDCDQIVVLNYP